MTDQQDTPQCPHGHGPMVWTDNLDAGDLLNMPIPAGWWCHVDGCEEYASPTLLAQEYERGRQDERQRAEARVRELEEALTAIRRDASRLVPFCGDGRHALEMIANMAGNALSKATAHERDTCADCGTALKVSPPSPVTGGAWHHYCPNEACPSKAPPGRCWCGAALVNEGGILECPANENHRPCPNCKQWVEWRHKLIPVPGAVYQHIGDSTIEPCPGPNKESDDA